MSLKSRRSQVSMMDLLIAFTLFTAIILQNHFMWTQVELKITNTEQRFYFEDDLRNVVESLISTRGEPYNWEELSVISDITVQTFGLAKAKNELDNTKLYKLKNTSYYKIEKTLLPTGKLNIEIRNESGIVFTYGPEPQGIVVRIDRHVMINNSIYTLIIKGWRS